jgi:hypothetical protein
MILSTHALTGAVIGKNINNIWLIIILSLAFHFFMDSLRHGEYFNHRQSTFKNTWWKIALDLFVAFSIIFSIFTTNNWSEKTLFNVALGIFFSLLPDGLTLLYYLKIRNIFLNKIKAFHSFCHCYSRYPKHSPQRQWTLRNSFNDIFLSILAIIILIFF